MRFAFKPFCHHLLLLFISISLTACVSEEQLPNTNEGNFESLWRIIDEHYCFLDYKRTTLGVDWDEVKARYSQQLNKNMSSEQLFEVLANMLSELRDGHINLVSSANLGRNWSWYEDYPLNFSQPLQDAYLGTDYKMAASLKYQIFEDNIGYLVCSSFASGFGDGNLDEVMNALKLCNGLILDIRNNGGGDLTIAERLAKRFTNERRLVGYIQHKTGKGHNDFSTPEPQYLEPSSGLRWQKKVIVLTNRRCYSATNTLVRDLKCCPNITILGDQTGGGSGMPFSSELPNGWAVRFSAVPMFDKDMNQIEFGIMPDVPCSLTTEDEQQGRDTLIEKARTLLRQ